MNAGIKKLTTPLSKNAINGLNAGDQALLNGRIYTARDQAHYRFIRQINRGLKLPFDLAGAVIYYCGPAAALPAMAIGSCGPTTSARMDKFTPALLERGLSAMIGKGSRSGEVVEAIKKHRAVYFVTYAGCGALLAGCVKRARLLAYPDLGPEAVFELEVENFPLYVGIDHRGRSVIYGKK